MHCLISMTELAISYNHNSYAVNNFSFKMKLQKKKEILDQLLWLKQTKLILVNIRLI